MSVVIRLSRAGRVHLPYYHIGVYNSRTRRDGRPVEELGFYDPRSEKEPVRLDVERAKHWLGVGAKPSATVAKILKLQGFSSADWSAKKAPTKADKEKKVAARKASAKKASAAKKTAKPAAKRKARTVTSKARGEKAKKA